MNKELRALDECKAVLKSNPGTKQYYDIFEKYWLGTIEQALKDFVWLKSIINIDFFYTLPIEDRLKLAEILGYPTKL